jgi:hypothetical protein
MSVTSKIAKLKNGNDVGTANTKRELREIIMNIGKKQNVWKDFVSFLPLLLLGKVGKPMHIAHSYS